MFEGDRGLLETVRHNCGDVSSCVDDAYDLRDGSTQDVEDAIGQAKPATNLDASEQGEGALSDAALGKRGYVIQQLLKLEADAFSRLGGNRSEIEADGVKIVLCMK